MALTLPPPLLQKVLAKRALQFKEGKVLLWSNPCFIDPIPIQIYYARLIEESCGVKKANTIRYQTARLQARTGIRMINERFGYAKTFRDKHRLFEFQAGQSELLGLGKFTWQKRDFAHGLFACTVKSPYAQEYKKLYGLQKHAVDTWLMGALAGRIEAFLEVPCLAVETHCHAKGDRHCQFIIKPIVKWQKQDPFYKKYQYLIKEEFDQKALERFMIKHQP